MRDEEAIITSQYGTSKKAKNAMIQGVIGSKPMTRTHGQAAISVRRRVNSTCHNSSLSKLSSSQKKSNVLANNFVPEQITNFNDNIIDLKKLSRFHKGIDEKIKNKYVNQSRPSSWMSMNTNTVKNQNRVKNSSRISSSK